jgi:hypothetical protein
VHKKPRHVFVWLPVGCEDGRLGWLEWVWAHHDGTRWVYSIDPPTLSR